MNFIFSYLLYGFYFRIVLLILYFQEEGALVKLTLMYSSLLVFETKDEQYGLTPLSTNLGS